MIVSLDLGLTTGYALKNKHGFTHGLIKFNKDRYSCFSSWIKRLIEEAKENEEKLYFAVEMPHGGYFNASRVLFGFIGVLEAAWPPENIFYYSPKSVKKFWTGSGNADKEEMIKATKRRLGLTIKDHNQNDAIALFYYHLEQSK